MNLDIIIFAVVAAFLVYRLNSVLGTRNESDRERPNPFIAPEKSAAPALTVVSNTEAPVMAEDVSAYIGADPDGRIATGLDDIRMADPSFTTADFMAGARYAFGMIVKAYAAGDRGALRPLLSPKLYEGFAQGITAREAAGQTASTEIHRIKAVRIIEAHLGGTMAYITVDYDVEQTAVTRDSAGVVIEGDPNRITTVEDIWTFTRDIRADDPNWTLIETRAAENNA